jgi:CHAT domain-containing protein/predicted negative regulator of RcsB-dependent stress response
VLCCLHFGLLGANQTQQSCPQTANPVTAQGLKDYGKALRDCGQISKAIPIFERAVSKARQEHDSAAEADALMFLGSVQSMKFQYRAALESLEAGLALSEKIHDYSLAGRASGNIANLYSQLGDFLASEGESERAIAAFQKIAKPNDLLRTRLAKALLIHARVCFELKRSLQGYKDYEAALSLAQANHDILLQAAILDERGVALMTERKIDEAAAAFRQAIQLSQSRHDLDRLASEREHVAELEIQKEHPDFQMALRQIDEAFASSSSSFNSTPQYYPIDIRGRILLGSGNKSAALTEFNRAVTVASQWRRGAFPGDTTSTQTVAQLQQVYSDYTQLAAETALQNGDNQLAQKALAVLAENRAASLREQLQVVFQNNGRLTDEYFTKLAQLQAAQAEVTLGHNTKEDQARLLGIRLEISHIENRIGIQTERFVAVNEKNSGRNSLSNIQRSLSRNQVLISISLGKQRSYLWSVTAEKVNLSRLPGEEELTSKADLFASAIRTGRDASRYADGLTRALFAGLPADVWKRSEWLMVADGPLLTGIPFCALNDLSASSSPKPLIEDISLRFLPSELLLANRQTSALRKSFLGIGDPIYNQADARLVRASLPDARTLPESITLARLVGSEKEIRSAAKETKLAETILLTGPKATKTDMLSAFGHDPGIVHFAVHVVSPPGQPQEAALALSLKNGLPELLTPEVIASFHIPGSLVVLSGCASGQGKVLPGAGLVGLSRAWLLAGAAAVVVSSWPTPDDSGKFFSSFYGHFDQILSGDTAQRAALALRRAQLDMLRGSGYQTSPSFWGAFAVISKE